MRRKRATAWNGETWGVMARTKKGQSSQFLASVSIATIMLALVASYAATERQLSVSQQSMVPLTLRHLKSDVDSDFHALFCDAGLCVDSSHTGDAVLRFYINGRSSLFQNLSNFSESYASFFNSQRSQFFAGGLGSQLSENKLLLGENATGSNLSITDLGFIAIEFNSSEVNFYGLGFECENTTDIVWSPETGNGDINLSLHLSGYAQAAVLNRSIDYETSFSTTCGETNITMLQGNLRSNFSYQNVSLNTTIPTNGSVGVYPLLNKTTVSAPETAFFAICPSGNEPAYPASVSNKRYGSFNPDGNLVHIILANRSGTFSTAYIDTNGDCNFTDFNDEYFVLPGEWVNIGEHAAMLESIATDGSGTTFVFSSAGLELEMLKARLVQPIHLNK